MPPALTVIAATHNGEPTLRRMLDSLLALEAPAGGWQLIFVDNASSDRTAAILGECRAKLPLTVLAEPGRGKNRALYRALQEPLGELVVFTDDDNLADPRWLIELQDCAAHHPGSRTVRQHHRSRLGRDPGRLDRRRHPRLRGLCRERPRLGRRPHRADPHLGAQHDGAPAGVRKGSPLQRERRPQRRSVHDGERDRIQSAHRRGGFRHLVLPHGAGRPHHPRPSAHPRVDHEAGHPLRPRRALSRPPERRHQRPRDQPVRPAQFPALDAPRLSIPLSQGPVAAPGRQRPPLGRHPVGSPPAAGLSDAGPGGKEKQPAWRPGLSRPSARYRDSPAQRARSGFKDAARPAALSPQEPLDLALEAGRHAGSRVGL
ncbi:MAG: glycosyltransferase family 2 protein [Azonexus sp.]|nr:glycosyltransferase family 2 protein [Azonexus sp.]MBP6905426.1 glycosyltransferase family 2 protein [Azonexus sp.]